MKVIEVTPEGEEGQREEGQRGFLLEVEFEHGQRLRMLFDTYLAAFAGLRLAQKAVEWVFESERVRTPTTSWPRRSRP